MSGYKTRGARSKHLPASPALFTLTGILIEPTRFPSYRMRTFVILSAILAQAFLSSAGVYLFSLLFGSRGDSFALC